MTAAASAYLSVATLPSQRAKRPNVTAVGMLCPLVAGPERGFAAVLSTIAALACFVVGVAFGGEASAAATDSAYAQAREIEGYLHGFPKRAQDELALLLTRRTRRPRTSVATSTRSTARRQPPLAGTPTRWRSPTVSSARQPLRPRTRCSPPRGSCAARRNGGRATPPRPTHSRRRLVRCSTARRPVPRGIGPRCRSASRRASRGQLEEVAWRAAGRAVAGRAAGQSVPPLRRALPAFQSVSDVEAAAERARREPARRIGSARPPAARRRW